eukprot:COSAG01_NODE_549_length_15608_cov_206.443355_9_plen_126_part_00
MSQAANVPDTYTNTTHRDMTYIHATTYMFRVFSLRFPLQSMPWRAAIGGSISLRPLDLRHDQRSDLCFWIISVACSLKCRCIHVYFGRTRCTFINDSALELDLPRWPQGSQHPRVANMSAHREVA